MGLSFLDSSKYQRVLYSSWSINKHSLLVSPIDPRSAFLHCNNTFTICPLPYVKSVISSFSKLNYLNYIWYSAILDVFTILFTYSWYRALLSYILQNSCKFSKDGVTTVGKSRVTTIPIPISKVYLCKWR